MKTKFDTFLNENIKYSVKFSDEVKAIMREAESRVADLLRERLKGRIVAFHTENFFGPNFKKTSFTSHYAILKVEDIIYRPDLADQYTEPFLIKSMDRIRPIWSKTNPRDQVGMTVYDPYCDVSPTTKFFYIDSYMKNFQKYFGKEITFTGSKDADALRGFSKIKEIKAVPVNIEIKLDAAHQHDLLRITSDDGNKYYIDFQKPIKVAGVIDEIDPYGEEVWD